MEVIWFRHNHEDRADLLRFGLMRLHYAGSLRYTERPLAEVESFGFSKAILDYPDHRHLSFLLVKDGRRQVKCLIDNEDSFALITPLITEVDICFCAGYNSDFFVRKQFVKPYAWQTDDEIDWYRKTISDKIDQLGEHFGKIKKFVPPTTNMCASQQPSWWGQKWGNGVHKLRKAFSQPESFAGVYKAFEKREAQLLALRDQPLQYDVVLRDSLWGWPRHRVSLHRQLQVLHRQGYHIHSSLTWADPVICDGSVHKPLEQTDFPILTGELQGSYEQMLAKSRLAVFASGFHWGWRSVMMLALGIGLPVLTDRLLTEAHFDMTEFELWECEDGNWQGMADLLQTMTPEKWQAAKVHNAAVYDKYMQPEAVATYFLAQVPLS